MYYGTTEIGLVEEESDDDDDDEMVDVQSSSECEPDETPIEYYEDGSSAFDDTDEHLEGYAWRTSHTTFTVREDLEAGR